MNGAAALNQARAAALQKPRCPWNECGSNRRCAGVATHLARKGQGPRLAKRSNEPRLGGQTWWSVDLQPSCGSYPHGGSQSIPDMWQRSLSEPEIMGTSNRRSDAVGYW